MMTATLKMILFQSVILLCWLPLKNDFVSICHFVMLVVSLKCFCFDLLYSMFTLVCYDECLFKCFCWFRSYAKTRPGERGQQHIKLCMTNGGLQLWFVQAARQIVIRFTINTIEVSSAVVSILLTSCVADPEICGRQVLATWRTL